MSTFAKWTLIVAASLLAYVLSIGPAYMLAYRSYCPGAVVDAIYYPLWSVRLTIFGRVITAYIEWWADITHTDIGY